MRGTIGFRPQRLFFAASLMLGGALICAAPSQAQFAPQGGLDCNGLSQIQKPIKPSGGTLICADFLTPGGAGEDRRGEDNGVYIGHDEPSIGFYSTASHSASNLQWEFTLPVERPLPATQTFENYIAVWLSLALCDPGSFPNGPCIPKSDANDPNEAGSALLELQFYPPAINCDDTHWCAALNIDSLEVMSNGQTNPNCTEPVNFAFIQTDGVPTGPPGPGNQTTATFTPDANTLLMNQGDKIRVTIRDVPGDPGGGLIIIVKDQTAGQSGFMIASAANGFQNTNPNSCATAAFSFRPEYDSAKFGNFVPWAALQANVNIAFEIGHFTPGANGDNDADDAPCVSGLPVPGCFGADTDFDGTSYLADWPDRTPNNATPISLPSLGPRSVGAIGYTRRYPQIQFETAVGASESTCMPDGTGCVVPPTGAAFYPYYSVVTGGLVTACALEFGNIHGLGVDTFGGDAQYGAPNLSHFFGNNSGGLQPTPSCF